MEQRADVNSRWPSDRCDDGRINADKAEACIEQARELSCSGFSALGDVLDLFAECSADQVCTDPAN